MSPSEFNKRLMRVVEGVFAPAVTVFHGDLTGTGSPYIQGYVMQFMQPPQHVARPGMPPPMPMPVIFPNNILVLRAYVKDDAGAIAIIEFQVPVGMPIADDAQQRAFIETVKTEMTARKQAMVQPDKPEAVADPVLADPAPTDPKPAFVPTLVLPSDVDTEPTHDA